MKMKAFTLAEVLLTLTIIGIVSAMTVPSLINSINEAEYKNGWKKAFSDINQVIQRIKVDNYGSLPDFTNTTRSLYPVFGNYVISNKLYGYGFPSNYSYPKIKHLNNTLVNEQFFDDGFLTLNNGYAIFINNYSVEPPSLIWVDVNGAKPPNVIGKDIFGATITRDGIKPFGSINDGHEGTCNTSSTGYGCSTLYLYQ